ncbi:MAG: hypothetical protein ACLVAA_04880 [Ruthenibacterium sp.]
MTLKGPGRKGVLTQKAMVLNWRLCRLMTQAPGKAGGLRKLGKGILPASLSRGAEKTPPASLALRPVNGRRLSKIIFLAIVKLFISSRFARCWKRKLFTLPSSAGGCHFAKAYNAKNAAQPEMAVQRFSDGARGET